MHHFLLTVSGSRERRNLWDDRHRSWTMLTQRKYLPRIYFLNFLHAGCGCLRGLQFLSPAHPGKQADGEGMAEVSISAVRSHAEEGPFSSEEYRHLKVQRGVKTSSFQMVFQDTLTLPRAV